MAPLPLSGGRGEQGTDVRARATPGRRGHHTRPEEAIHRTIA